MSASSSRSWPSPAKLNLFLRIVGRRADGYHELQTVFQLLDWGDRILVELPGDGDISRRNVNYSVPDSADIVVRAAKLLKKAANCSQGAILSVEKQIPIGGGFGGGSSNAATVLVALNAHWGCGLSVGELAALGLELGADVPVFVRGQSAWASGLGEQLVPLSLPPRWFLVVDSGVSVPTAELFQATDLTRDAAVATISDFLAGQLTDNAFEPVLRRRAPAVARCLDVLSDLGPAHLTGTGGGCFVAFESREAAESARNSLPSEFRAWIARGVSRSPLLDALDAFGGKTD